MFAPSLAAFKAMALPMPLLAPVMKRVHPASFLKVEGEVEGKEEREQRKTYKSLTVSIL